MSSASPPAAGTPREEVRSFAALGGHERVKAIGQSSLFVHQLFEAQAARTPEAIAVAFGDQALRYHELSARSNEVARRLRALGAGPEARVGVCLERSLEMVVSLFGVLKAGAAFVPLDPHLPAERLAFQTKDAQIRILVTKGDLGAGLDVSAAKRLVVDLARVHFDSALTNSVPAVVTHENIAYVIYTSGSTGKPKGVAIPHGVFADHCLTIRRTYNLNARDRVLQFASISFDAALEQIVPTLLAGASLVLQDPVPWSPADFPEKARQFRLSVINLPPAYWRLVAEEWAHESANSQPESVRLIILGGDAVLPRDIELWRRSPLRGARLLNAYGPTETTITATTFEVPTADFATIGRIPIGRPLPHRSAYVLDRSLRPCPIGVPGELCLGGSGLARGYLNRPTLTAEKFVPHPFATTPGARLYRTGDLVRWRPDGSIEMLGRIDRQVKVRGFRIELEEIESALAGCPSVRRAIVLARELSAGETQIVAYVECQPAADLSVSALRDALKAKLPDYMIPALFFVLESLPLTAGGKIDRQTLAELNVARALAPLQYESPRTPQEALVARTWASVLGRARVGVNDNFFDLGGHSLLATQVVSRLRNELGKEVPVRLLFEAPTVEGLAGRIEELCAGTSERAAGPIERAPRDGELPVSFAQEALWYLEQLTPGLPTFNVTVPARIRGPLDVAALERALSEILRRHESLRTTFTVTSGRPAQLVGTRVRLGLNPIDLSNLPDALRDTEVQRLLSDDARRPFDLARGPLIRATLLRLGDAEHAFLLTMHHIITDGWSFGVAASELAALYEAFRAGKPSPLAEPPIQYADYARWQRERLQGDLLHRGLVYWRNRLAEVPSLELPTDHPRPALRTQAGSTFNFSLSSELSGSLRSLSLQEGVTPFMMLLAAFQVLLHRYSGQNDFAVGSPLANRNRPELEGLIGYFINMVAFRADLSGDPSFRSLLGRVRETALEAYEHQELPFELVVENLHPERDPSRTPVFQVMFVLQNNKMPDVGASDLTLTSLDLPGGTGTAKFDLTLGMVETDAGFSGSWEYSVDLFDRDTMVRLAGHFTHLLEHIVRDPDRRVSELPIVGEQERARVIHDVCQTGSDLPAGACVLQRIEEQAARTPDRPAVSCKGGSLTYEELNARANQLGRYLRARGIGPERRVGIAVERSLEMAVGLLGVWKAGAAFVPLEANDPSERLSFLIRDAGIGLVLTRQHLRGRLPDCRTEIVCLDEEWDAIGCESSENLLRQVRADNLAYVLYTSGSTGQPRGVLVSHGALLNHNAAVARMFDLGPADRVLQFCSLSFDISMEEIFPAWMSGAEVVLRDDEFLDPAQFSRRLVEERITVVDLPTAFWHAWASGLKGAREPVPEALRLVVVGGEEASPAVYQTWHEATGGRIRWLNTYGPTEATVIATAYEAPGAGSTAEIARLPIGRPINDVRVYVLDRRLEPVPIGVNGELYIGGAGVARGYVNKPGLTAEQFLPDPFRSVAGARMYRTGDLARWRSDGTLEFFGRIDNQAKVRGYRIEPREIEATLLGCADVREAAVVVRKTKPGDSALVAYVAAQRDDAEFLDRLRRMLKERLPRYMIPAAIVVLESLPVTVAGKVDYRALPAPMRESAGRPSTAVGPRNRLEADLAAIWEEVVGVQPIGITDDFFDLGGHSLMAVRVAAKIEERLGRNVPLSAFLRGATIEELARALSDSGKTGASEILVPLTPAIESPAPPVFWVHPVGGSVMCYTELARGLGQTIPSFGLQAAGLDGESAPSTSIETMAERYIAALRAVQADGPYCLGGWSLGGVIAFEMAQQLHALGQDVESLILIDSHVPSPGDIPLDDDSIRAAFARDLTRLGVRAEELGTELARHLFEVFRANCRAVAAYVPRPYPGRATLIRARAAAFDGRGDATLGWGAVTLGGISTHALNADHYTLLQSPYVHAIAQIVKNVVSGPAQGRAGGLT
jgi:amino acid adenylation domain-containing protein